MQIHNLLMGLFSKAVTNQFGNFIGEFVEYDAKSVVAGLRNFMRIQVMVDIQKRLKRKKKLIISRTKEIFINFK